MFLKSNYRLISKLIPFKDIWFRADFRLVPSQLETALLCNDASYWLGANLESALWLAESIWVNITFSKDHVWYRDKSDETSMRYIMYFNVHARY